MIPTIWVFTGCLFVCCMFCHGELASRKPHPRYLTTFYVMISLGGAAGGLFVGLIAPNFFNGDYEFPIGMAICAALVVVTLAMLLRAVWWRAALAMVLCGYVFYLGPGALGWFMVCTFFLGLGGANFAVYSFWLPEQYGTECRVSAFAFCTNIGRFAGAGLTFLVGAGIQHYGTLGTPVALTSLAFVVGLLLLPFGVETKGKPLPA